MPATRGGAGPPAAKPPPPVSTASSSSHSSSRVERNARLMSIPQKSATPHSQTSEATSEPPRRSQRAQLPKKAEVLKDDIDGEDEAAIDAEEEEITRCVCGQQEYPGPPLSEAFDNVDPHAEDPGGLFISCDGCSVWQHGGCVGILEDAQVPEQYYCEECRPKLHEVQTDTRGQKYSLYQPVYAPNSRKPSVSRTADKAQKERDEQISRASTDPTTGRRRATMRSKEHDDEEEQFRRAIEESKRELGDGKTGRKNGKRDRDDGDDYKSGVKRQRRASEAVPAAMKVQRDEDDSEDELAGTEPGRGKRARADAVQSARQAQLAEKERERERARADAAGRRQERAGRRRVEDEPAEEPSIPTTSARASPPLSSPHESPQPVVASAKVSHKKGAGKKIKKLGNNQYTKHHILASPPGGKKSVATNNRNVSSGEDVETNGNGQQKLVNGSGPGKSSPERPAVVKGKFGRGRHRGVNGNGVKQDEPAELTMLTMKRRMDAMAAYIAKAQAELTGDRTPSNSGASRVSVEAVGPGGGTAQSPSSGHTFEAMTALEKADVVSRGISEWRKKFGVLT